MNRRQFMQVAGLTTASALLTKAPAVHANQKFEWKMATCWPENFPGLASGARFLKNAIENMSDNRISIKIYNAGELVPAFGVFDAVSKGEAEMGHSAPYYWNEKHPANNFFCGVPFGLNSVEMIGWLQYGGGQELWNEVYGLFDLKAFPVGNTGVQMGGWFNKEINEVGDLKGLTMRIPGLGGEVLTRLGAKTVNLPGGKLLDALKSGEINAAEWVSPYNDLEAKLYEAARYYYWPGWQEPGSTIDCFINKKAYESLPNDLKAIVEFAAKAAYSNMIAEYSKHNSASLVELVTKHKVQLKRFPDPLLAQMGKMAKVVVEEVGNRDPLTKKVYESFNQYRTASVGWGQIGEEAYSLARSLTFSF